MDFEGLEEELDSFGFIVKLSSFYDVYDPEEVFLNYKILEISSKNMTL